MKKLIIILVLFSAMLWTSSPIAAENKTSTAKTERVSNTIAEEQADKNPIVGTDNKGHRIHQGKKGGLYFWTITKKGENAGKARKQYLTKAQKDEFYKSHPQVKRPQQ
jgi:hypothetical protein